MPVDVDRFLQAAAATEGGSSPNSLCGKSGAQQGRGCAARGRRRAQADGRAISSSRFWARDRPSSRFEALARELGISNQMTWSPVRAQTQMPAEYGSQYGHGASHPGQGGRARAHPGGGAAGRIRRCRNPAPAAFPKWCMHEETGLLARQEIRRPGQPASAHAWRTSRCAIV